MTAAPNPMNPMSGHAEDSAFTRRPRARTAHSVAHAGAAAGPKAGTVSPAHASAAPTRATSTTNPHAGTDTLTIAWRLSRTRLIMLGYDIAPQPAAAPVRLVLTITWTAPGIATAHVDLIDPTNTSTARTLLHTPTLAAERIDDGQLVHIEAGRMLSATLRTGNAPHAALLYARTSLLTDLGLPGGRYETELDAVLSRKQTAAAIHS